MSKKSTIEQEKSFAEQQGYICLSDKYVNDCEKMRFKCPSGHEFEMSRHCFRRGQRCPICAGLKKHTIEQEREFAEQQGYICLSEEYVNNKTKLQYRCPEGHDFEMRSGCFRRGDRCPVCANNQKYTIEQEKAFAEQRGYICLSEEYVNSQTKLQYRCPEGHEFETKANIFHSGCGCPVCANNQKHTIEQEKAFAEQQGYICLSEEYVNNKTKLRYRCPSGHEFEMRSNCFQQGERCPTCAEQKTTSKAEKELLSYVESIYKGIILPNNRKQIINPKTGYGLELDIWMPEIGFAIEYNGMYYHSSNTAKYKDRQKVIQCQQKNYKLMIITDEEWKSDKTEIKATIDSLCNNL